MAKLRYKREFKKILTGGLILFIMSSVICAFFIISKIQYDSLISEMKSLEATIVDIDLDIHARGPDVQDIYITYEVDGVVYNRKLKTDTKIAFAAGFGAHYSVGDKVEIFYDPHNPGVIASPQSINAGHFSMYIGLIGLVLSLPLMFDTIKNRRKFLVTQEDYEKEKEELKKSKGRKVVKVTLIVIVALIGMLILFRYISAFITYLVL